MSTERLVQDQVMDALQNEANEFKDLSKLNVSTPPPGNPLMENTQPIVEVNPLLATPLPQEAPPAVESSKQINLRLMRERAEAAERKQVEIERKYAAMEEQLKYKQTNTPPAQPQEAEKEIEFTMADDELMEGKHVKQIVNALKKEIKDVKQQVNQFNQTNSAQSAELRFQSQYPDAQKVLTDDNIKNFAKIYPEEYRSMMSNSDVYAQLKTAYTMITKFGLLESYDEDPRAIANQSKPKSAASAGSPQGSQTPLTRLGDYDRRVLTKADKERIMQQVNQAKQYI